MKKSTREDSSGCKFVALGASLGGSDALRALLAELPANFPPLGVVLHRGSDDGGDTSLIEYLRKNRPLKVRVVEDKTLIAPGTIYLAPADYHLLIDGDHFALSTEAPVHYARPSIDVFFESVAESFGGKVVGVILTGNNDDGARGLAAVKRHGGVTVVQSPETAYAPRLPEAALACGAEIDRVLPLDRIAWFLAEIAQGRKQD
jgi:two-component system chemotaxis response regulator CheB